MCWLWSACKSSPLLCQRLSQQGNACKKQLLLMACRSLQGTDGNCCDQFRWHSDPGHRPRMSWHRLHWHTYPRHIPCIQRHPVLGHIYPSHIACIPWHPVQLHKYLGHMACILWNPSQKTCQHCRNSLVPSGPEVVPETQALPPRRMQAPPQQL